MFVKAGSKMPIDKPNYQLEFALDLPEENSGNLALSPEEVRLRAETARQALDDKNDTRWRGEYIRLRDHGWNWRVAAYIAWASSPKVNRKPATQDELAREYLGLNSDRVIASWRKKNPAIDEMVMVLQSAPLWEERADHFDALNDGARKSKDDYKFFPYLKMVMEMRNDYVPTAKLDALLRKNGISKGDLADMSEEELAVTKAKLQDMLNVINGDDEDGGQ